METGIERILATPVVRAGVASTGRISAGRGLELLALDLFLCPGGPRVSENNPPRILGE
jgi:hypothetical protein